MTIPAIDPKVKRAKSIRDQEALMRVARAELTAEKTARPRELQAVRTP
jgi:hypothetical protein